MKKIVILATLIAFVGMAPLANALVKDTNINDIRTHSGGIVVGDSVRITDGVITGIDINRGGAYYPDYGFWVQDLLGGPYSGILIYMDVLYPTGFRRGQIVRATGQYAEYYNVGYPGTWPYTTCSEIQCLYSWQLDTLGVTDVPAPLLKSCSELAYDATPYDTAKGSEQWENMLIKVDSVVVVNGVGNDPRQYVIREAHNHAGATLADTVLVRNDKMDPNAPLRPADGDTLFSITGIWYYGYGKYRLCPRDGEDIVGPPPLPPPPHLVQAFATTNTSIDVVFDMKLEKTSAENINNYYLWSETQITLATLDPVGEQIVTLTTATQVPGTYETLTACCIRGKGEWGTVMPASQDYSFRSGLCPISLVQTPKAVDNDSSQYAGDEVTIAGIVTGDKGAFTTQFYVENTPGGPWSGIQVYGIIPTSVAEGDSIIVAGFVSEYYNKTEITSVDYLRVVGSGNPIPGPDWVLPGQIKTGSATAESYEGVFVRCDPVFVSDTIGFAQYGEWRVCDSRYELDTVMVGHAGKYTYVPRPDPCPWMNIRGPIDYAYDNYRIEPRRDTDIDTTLIGVDPGTLPKPPVFALEQNFPNPFNPVTNIFFTIPQRVDVELYVCDVSGRVIKRLVDGVAMGPGRHKATWDGSNDAGKAVSAGIYFCNLVATDKVARVKMVILR